LTRGYRQACFSFSTLLAAGILTQPVPVRAPTVQSVTFAESERAGDTILMLHNASLLR